jgi:hypothetical protein
VYGTEISLRQSLVDGWSGWLAWTISRGERRRSAGEEYRPFDFDQPHVVSASVNKRSRDWSFAALVRYASGSPRTPVVDAFYNVSLGRHEPIFGEPNSTRLPATFELDLRVDRRLVEFGGNALWLYIDALNVTLHENAEAIVYSADYRDHDYLTGPPALVDVGLRLER